jgi:hypothetical protein
MGLRLSFGIGPLRASIPLTSRRKRRRRTTVRNRKPTFHATVHLPDGSVYTCHHAHRTEQAAIECAAKYRRAIIPQKYSSARQPRDSTPRNKAQAQVSKAPKWWPRAGWGTTREVRIENGDNGRVNLSFKFVPDDGSEPRIIELTDAAPIKELGEYARGIISRNNVTIKVSAGGMAEAENEIFKRINHMEQSKRKIMFANRSDIAGDCGWAWTSDYTLVKVAPGLFD